MPNPIRANFLDLPYALALLSDHKPAPNMMNRIASPPRHGVCMECELRSFGWYMLWFRFMQC